MHEVSILGQPTRCNNHFHRQSSMSSFPLDYVVLHTVGTKQMHEEYFRGVGCVRLSASSFQSPTVQIVAFVRSNHLYSKQYGKATKGGSSSQSRVVLLQFLSVTKCGFPCSPYFKIIL
jgi:hypothetical protein